MLARLGLKVYSYAPPSVPLKSKLVPDKVLDVCTAEALVSVLQDLNQFRPVLVFAGEATTKLILERIIDAVHVTIDTDASLLAEGD